MHGEGSVVERAQAALDAWLRAVSSWNADQPPSSLRATACDRWVRQSECIDDLYRRWREVAREVITQVEQKRQASTSER